MPSAISASGISSGNGVKIYLAGRIRGREGYQRVFAAAACKLRLQGHTVYNPAASNMEGMSLRFIMAHHLPQLCECDAIAMLPWWWTRFGGAWVEWLLAKYLGLRVVYL